MWRIHAHNGAKYMLFVCIRGATVQVEKKLAFFTVCQFLDKILLQLNIKAVQNLKTKSSSINLI